MCSRCRDSREARQKTGAHPAGVPRCRHSCHKSSHLGATRERSPASSVKSVSPSADGDTGGLEDRVGCSVRFLTSECGVSWSGDGVRFARQTPRGAGEGAGRSAAPRPRAGTRCCPRAWMKHTERAARRGRAFPRPARGISRTTISQPARPPAGPTRLSSARHAGRTQHVTAKQVTPRLTFAPTIDPGRRMAIYVSDSSLRSSYWPSFVHSRNIYAFLCAPGPAPRGRAWT